MHIFVIFCKCTFDPVDLVGYLEVLDQIRKYHRVGCVKYFVMVGGWFSNGMALVKYCLVLLKRSESGRLS